MNNRELATFILFATFALLALASSDVRRTLPSLAKQLFLSKLTPLILVFGAAEVSAVLLAARFSLWSFDLLGGTILWFLLVGLAWFVNLGEAGRDPNFFRHRFSETLSITAFLEFFVNAQVMPLALEVVAQTALLVVVGVSVVASSDQQYRLVAVLTSTIMILATLGLLTYSVLHAIGHWDTLGKRELANEILLPVWLSAAAILVLYSIALFMGYELLFIRLSFLNEEHKPTRRAMVGIACSLWGALVAVDQFHGDPAREAARATTVKAARNAVSRFKKERAEDFAAQAEARQRLADHTGRVGVDENGRLLDRREFAETKDALRWLITCHMGWYRNGDQPDRYRPDLLEALSGARQFGFETEPIASAVRKDGQAWFAYRRTPSGRIFGIGASGPPPSQWFYDAVVPPSDFPSDTSSSWTAALSGERLEWEPEPNT